MLDGYHKKKYVCKLLFIFLLGHDIDFGYTEAVNLLCSNRYTEKQIVCSLQLPHQILGLFIHICPPKRCTSSDKSCYQPYS